LETEDVVREVGRVDEVVAVVGLRAVRAGVLVVVASTGFFEDFDGITEEELVELRLGVEFEGAEEEEAEVLTFRPPAPAKRSCSCS
jgi:hypothetical protein